MKRAIGVIDSGIGGLTVAHELMRQLPKENLIYVGDTKRCPYGPRPQEEVMKYTWEMVKFLLEKDIKILVIACNTATAFTIEVLRKKLTIPVIGVIEPGARAAIKHTKNMCIGIIGTEGTIKSNAYVEALHKINPEIIVHPLACPLLVPLVESGDLVSKHAENIVETSVKQIKEENKVDTLILGCTHYPIIKHLIQEILGEHVTLVSSSEETARETSLMLDIHNLLYRGPRQLNHLFYTTGNVDAFKVHAKNIFKDTKDIFNLVTCTHIELT